MTKTDSLAQEVTESRRNEALGFADPGQAPQGTQSVVRALRLLKLFTPSRPEWTLKELGEFSGLNRSTTHRLLSALESEALLQRSPASGNFRLGPCAYLLGAAAPACANLRTRVRPTLERLARTSRETATLEILEGQEMLILDEVAGDGITAPSGNIGTRWPMHATATGKALLSVEPALLARLTYPLTSHSAHTLTEAAPLKKDLQLTVERGYAIAIDELEEGFSAIALRLDGSDRAHNAVLSIGGYTERFRRRLDELAALLRDAVRELRDDY